MEKTGKIRKCLACGKDVYVNPYRFSSQKYCSYSCSSLSLKEKKCKICNSQFTASNRKNICYKCLTKKCKRCQNEFSVSPSDYYRQNNNYCSRLCLFGDRNGKVELTCKLCQKKYKTYKSHKMWRGSSFCSNKCRWEFNKTKSYQLNIKVDSPIKLKKQLWSVFSRYIRQRDGGVCISCGDKNYWRDTDAGHFIPKTSGLSLYFDERNVNCQCTNCNRFLEGNIEQYEKGIIKKYGHDVLKELNTKKNLTRKIDVSEYLKLIEYFKREELKLKNMDIILR